MKNILNTCMLLLTSCFFAGNVTAQSAGYATTKEKIYIHTNHVFFKPGEQVYFKLYLLNAMDQTPSLQSNIVYVEVLNPSGNVVQKLTYKTENGYTEGSYDFNHNAVGGMYKLRAYTTWMQNEKEATYFIKELTVQKVIAPRVLMKLDFPRKGYGAGDEVLADFSMRSLDDQPIKNYEAKFTVSVGGTQVETGLFYTSNQGKAAIKFYLPKELKTTDGLLNVTINYDAYTEAISRSIPIVLNKIDLQLMPEGGTLINGITTKIAFKVVNENGKAADIKGEIVDDEGKRITTFTSYHFGMGKFEFTPQMGRSYKAKITAPTNILQQYQLPQAAGQGVVMNFSKADGQLLIKLTSSLTTDIKLVGQSRNVSYYSQHLSLKKGEKVITIEEKIFPAGIAQFTILTDGGVPLAERLCFMNPQQQIQASITTDKPKYLPREKVTMTLKTLDESGKPLPSNFSLAVVDDKLWSFADDKQDHILSWLLMSSELKGKVEEPQFYFKKDEPKANAALDLVMLTNGYRYFDFIEYVQKEGTMKFTPDQDNIVSGIVMNEKNEPVKSTIYLVNAAKNDKAFKLVTGDDGVYFFRGLLPQSNYYLFAKSAREKEKIKIEVLQNGFGYNPLKAKEIKQFINEPIAFAALKKTVPVNKPAELVNLKILMDKSNTNLDDVVVIGYGTQRRRDVTGSVSTVSAKDLLLVNNFNAVLQGRVAGVVVQNGGNPGANAVVRIRGVGTLADNNQPLYIINGLPVERLDANLNPNDIESITVLKDAEAVSLYGSKAANGVIVIESKKLRNDKLRFKFEKEHYYASKLVYPLARVYSAARKFYTPLYQSLQTDVRNDFRETVYWNPVVQTGKDGTATVEFYNSDASTTFRAIAEGIGYNGKLGRAEATYAVQNAISTDAKIPPYLTVGDKALIPVVIKNNREEYLDAFISVVLPENMKAGDYTKEIHIAAGASLQVLIPVEATAAVNGNIEITINGQFGRETLSLPITATDKGFPVIATFSGNNSGKHHFNISKIIPGSLHSQLKLFKNVEGQLVDGIESMLREPYGCFEQTSSSTYPNIYVLKYLRESGKSNPEIEKRALGLIEKGYQRLIGFETSQNGFEWFGRAPAHEALTAYGLLEFTDMQQFIMVDKKMLERTKAFLMSRRDGQGGFKTSSGGYDRFASVPNKIANIYIVYALTQAGIGSEIKPEYESAVNKAIQTNDGYQLAMMALAANNMKNDGDYNRLMNLLRDCYYKNKLASETSVVNSRDASLRVEAMSLYLLALARQPQPDLGLMAQLMTKIMGEKSYYGYGSTQSTVLALNAVVAYSKAAGKVASETEINFAINNATVAPYEVSGSSVELKEGSNTFTVEYGKTKNSVPYNFEVSYNTFTPPNSEKAELKLQTQLKTMQTKVGETVRMDIVIKNEKDQLQPMAIAKIGIPAGLSLQPWQLKELAEKKEVAYYEIFDNYLVLYWMGFAATETKTIHLDLKAEIPGTYKGKASNAYLYYTPEYKHWNDGVEVDIKP